MNESARRLVDHSLLWHCTARKNAEAISRAGFRLGRKRRWHREKVTYFFHSAIPFLEMVTESPDQADCDGLFCAVDLDRYTFGRDYTHEMMDVFVFHVPLPKDMIVARFGVGNINRRADLKRVLSEHLQCDAGSAFSEICLDEAISWDQVTCIASTLRALDEDSYQNAGVTKRLIREEMGDVDDRECERLSSLLVESHPAFHRRFLDLYYGEYPFPHFARALMVAGARFVHPLRILAFHDPTVVIPDRPESRRYRGDDASVAALLAELLPRLGRKEVVFGAIEMAAMRKFPGGEPDLKGIEHWLAQQGALVEEIAFYFVRFGRSSLIIRRGGRAVSMAVAALRGTGRDYYERLSSLAETDDPAAHYGLMQAFGLLKEKQAIPYLSSRLKDERKEMRVHAVEALDQIGTPEAIELVRRAASDKAKAVKRAVQKILGDGL